MIQDYYQTLGIPLNSSLEEVKKAFRKRAKELHPDLNPAPDAKERFIELSKAYEFLLFYKSSGREGSNPEPVRARKPAQQTYTWQQKGHNTHAGHAHQSQSYSRQWNEEEAHKRAEAHARMKYKEYVNSPHYKETQAFETAVGQIFTLVAYALIILPALAGLVIGRGRGFLVGLGVTAFTSPAWGGILRDKHKINLRQLGEALATLAKSSAFGFVLGVPLNVILFFTITDRAVVPTWIFPLSLAACMAGCWVLHARLKKRMPGLKRSLMLATVAPAVVNLFFFVNYRFSSSPVTETYRFDPLPPSSVFDIRAKEHDPWMRLENDQYGSCGLIRFFWDAKDVFNRKSVRYEMETGLFGIKVMKGRRAI